MNTSKDRQEDIEKDNAGGENENLKLLTELIGKSTEKTVKALSSKNLLENVAIFVDYDNVYWTLQKNYNHDPDHKNPEKNLFNQLWQRYGQDNVRTFRVYADFQYIRTSLTNLQKNRVQIRHVYSNGKESENSRKNSSDIELCIDAIENTYKDQNISCYVFVTADSDMIPILSRLMYKGKRVELFYLSDAAPKYVDLSTYVHYSEDLMDFLNIERITYDTQIYLKPTLELIEDWHDKHGESDKFLGNTWLKGVITKELSIPERISSDVIEALSLKDWTTEDKKTLSDGTDKTTIVVSELGKKILEEDIKEIAATEE